jgi:penicillin amidase
MTTDVNALTELARASNIGEAEQAMRNFTAAGGTIMVIDTNGDIGWFTFAAVPLRPWASPSQPAYLPLDGTGANEWEGFIDYPDLPGAINPERGFLAASNNDMTGANTDGDPTNDGHPLLQTYPANGFRHERIVDRLEASDQHTPETMLDIVGDTYSLVGEAVSPVFLAVDRDDLSANAQALYDAIDGWGFTCPTGLATSDPDGDLSSDPDERTEALGCAAFHRVLSETWSLWIWDERDDRDWVRNPFLSAFFRALARPEELTHPDLFWDDITTATGAETRQQVLAAAFERAANRLEAQVGDDPSGWLWGRLHTLTIRADLFSSFGVNRYDEGPVAKDGGLYTVNVAPPIVGASSMSTTFGASERLICEANAEGVTCSVQLAGGQPHLRDADAYFSLFEHWLADEPVALPFDHAALDEPAIVGRPAEE